MDKDLIEMARGHSEIKAEQATHVKGFKTACNLVLSHYDSEDTDDFADFLNELSNLIYMPDEEILNSKVDKR